MSQRRKAAIALAWIHRAESGKPVELSCLTIGFAGGIHIQITRRGTTAGLSIQPRQLPVASVDLVSGHEFIFGPAELLGINGIQQPAVG